MKRKNLLGVLSSDSHHESIVKTMMMIRRVCTIFTSVQSMCGLCDLDQNADHFHVRYHVAYHLDVGLGFEA